jgi:chaperonin cofactor prefoldin
MFKSIVAETLFEALLNDMISDFKGMLQSRDKMSNELNENKSKLIEVLLEDNSVYNNHGKILRIVNI